MINVTDQRYLEQINEPFRNSFSAEVKLFFKNGTVTFTDSDIISIDEDESANIVADENPSQSASIVLSNYNHQFDINGTSGYFRDISDGIECQYRFGFHVIDDDGTDDIVWLDWKRRWCEGDPSLSENNVRFTVVDALANNSDTIESYFASNYQNTLINAFNKSTYPKQDDGSNALSYDSSLTDIVTYYTPSLTTFTDIIQSIAFASGMQFYIGHDGVIHIDNERADATASVSLDTNEYYEDNEVGKDKKLKRITISYYVSESSNLTAPPDKVREIGGIGDSVTISNDFICSNEDGNRVMSYLVNYYEQRGTFECTFRGDPRLEPLDKITIDILNSDGTVQTINGTIISLQNTFDGNFESTISVKYLTTDETDDVAEITGAENFTYPFGSDTASPASVTLSCTTSVTSPTYVWEYYNLVTAQWTQIGTGQTLTVTSDSAWLTSDEVTTFRCTVSNSVSSSVGIRRVYQDGTYNYLGILDTAPSNPSRGDYYLAPTGIVYLWNGEAWAETTRSDLLMSAVADGKTLTGIEDTPLGQLIASMDGTSGKTLILQADNYFFNTDADGNVKPNQTITLTVQKSNIDGTVIWADNKNINVPADTLTYEFKSEIEESSDTPVNLMSNAIYDPTFETIPTDKVVVVGVADNMFTIDTTTVSSFEVTNNNINGLEIVNGIPDGTYYGQSIRLMAGAPDSLINIEHKFYIRYEVSHSVDIIMGYTRPYYITSNNEMISSVLYDDQFFIPTGGHVYYVYFCSLIIDTENFTPYTSDTLKATKPVIVDITANQDFFTAKGLTTDDAIKAYLDGIAYEDFTSGSSSAGKEVENLTADFAFIGDVGTLPAESSITGNAENIIMPEDGYGTDVFHEELGNLGTYYYQVTAAYAFFINSGIDFAHKFYVGCDSDIDTQKTIVIYNPFINEFHKLERTGNRHSIIGSNLIANPPIEGSDVGQVAIYGVISESEFQPYTAETLKINHLIVVDITANQEYFTSLGLTTDEEIRNYLDGVAYDDFGKEIENVATPNPALDGTPTLFTITADGLSSTVQIGYVADGEQGTTARVLLITADNQTLQADSDGTVKTGQTVTLTVQAQNLFDPIVWTNNIGATIPTDTKTFTFNTTDTTITSNPVFTVTSGDISDTVTIAIARDGATGEEGKSITQIDTFYLATSANTGVTVETVGWTDTPQTMTNTNRYLWIYQDIYYSDGTFTRIDPYITGVYGDKGDTGSAGEPTLITLTPSASTYEVSSRGIVQEQVVITVTAEVLGIAATPTWTVTPAEADGYTTGKNTDTITVTIPVGSSLNGFTVSAVATAGTTSTNTATVYINATPIGTKYPRFFEIRETAPTTADNQGEPFITGDHYISTDGVPTMYDESTNSWREVTTQDTYYDLIMENCGNYWIQQGNDVDTTVSALYAYFSKVYTTSVVADSISTTTLRMRGDGVIQSTVTDDTGERGYEPGDWKNGYAGYYLRGSDGYAEFYRMLAYGIQAYGSFTADSMKTVDAIPAISSSSLLSQYQSTWNLCNTAVSPTNVSLSSGYTGAYYLSENTAMYLSADKDKVIVVSGKDVLCIYDAIAGTITPYQVVISNVHPDAIVYDDRFGTFKAFYISRMSGSTTAYVYMATSFDGVTWTSWNSSPVITYTLSSRSNLLKLYGGHAGTYLYLIITESGDNAYYTCYACPKGSTSFAQGTKQSGYDVLTHIIPNGDCILLILTNTDDTSRYHHEWIRGTNKLYSSNPTTASLNPSIVGLTYDNYEYVFPLTCTTATPNSTRFITYTYYDSRTDSYTELVILVTDPIITTATSANFLGGIYDSLHGVALTLWRLTINGSRNYHSIISKISGGSITESITIQLTPATNSLIPSIGMYNGYPAVTYLSGNTVMGIYYYDGVKANTLMFPTPYSGGGTLMYYRDSDGSNEKTMLVPNTGGSVGSYTNQRFVLVQTYTISTITNFYSSVIPKMSSNVPSSEPLSDYVPVSGSIIVNGTTYQLSDMMCTNSTLHVGCTNGTTFEWSSQTKLLYPVTIRNLVIDARSAALQIGNVYPMENAGDVNIGSTGNPFHNIYCDRMYTDYVGDSSNYVSSGYFSTIYATNVGTSSSHVSTIYTDAIYIGSSRSEGTGGYYLNSMRGYSLLPNGLLLNWGKAYTTGGSDTWVDVTFRRSFGSLFSITYSIMHTGTLASMRVISSQSGHTPTSTGFRVQVLSNSSPTRYTFWMAIGQA